jgi:hypothetical protein
MLHGKMSYGRASEDGGDGNHTPMIPPIITGNRSMPVPIILYLTLPIAFRSSSKLSGFSSLKLFVDNNLGERRIPDVSRPRP